MKFNIKSKLQFLDPFRKTFHFWRPIRSVKRTHLITFEYSLEMFCYSVSINAQTIQRKRETSVIFSFNSALLSELVWIRFDIDIKDLNNEPSSNSWMLNFDCPRKEANFEIQVLLFAIRVSNQWFTQWQTKKLFN